MQTKLLLACWDESLAKAICTRLAQTHGPHISGEAAHMDSALSRVAISRPDVVLLEHMRAAEQTTWRMLGQLRQVCGHVRLLLLCDTCTQQMIIEFVQRGVNGYVPRSGDPSLLAKAVMAAHRGESWFGRTALLQALRSQISIEAFAEGASPEDHEPLTPREREILELIGAAMSNREISEKLKISEKTVKTHLHNIYAKLHTSGRYKVFLSHAAPGNGIEIGSSPRGAQARY